jgi:hypothetical protein
MVAQLKIEGKLTKLLSLVHGEGNALPSQAGMVYLGVSRPGR